MKKGKEIFSLFHKGSAIMMMLTLFWLTISTPFVCDFNERVAKFERSSTESSSSGSEENPLTNSPEEKVPSPNSPSEEYLHNTHISYPFISGLLQKHYNEDSEVYIAFHGELLVPPPNCI